MENFIFCAVRHSGVFVVNFEQILCNIQRINRMLLLIIWTCIYLLTEAKTYPGFLQFVLLKAIDRHSKNNIIGAAFLKTNFEVLET